MKIHPDIQYQKHRRGEKHEQLTITYLSTHFQGFIC